jgi:hypothetical protein
MRRFHSYGPVDLEEHFGVVRPVDRAARRGRALLHDLGGAADGQDVDSLDVAQRYQELIVALQDDDLTFPENSTFAYYAIYNLLKKYAKKEIV